MSEKLKAPFPYFGGKSSVADEVWKALGQPKHYIEPFFGSGAVLLGRPDYDPASHVETVNDKDGFVANVWRSLKFSPEKTAEWADWPVNHADLCARKAKLIASESNLLENLTKDDEWHDPKLAGYWIWACSCWIGTGLTSPGKVPHLSNAGKGIHAIGKRPHLGNAGMGEVIPKSEHIYEWFRALATRLRRVRVVCGDWKRVCGGNWQNRMGICGIFFDPPYADDERDSNIYQHDSMTVANEVREWAIKRGKLPSYRIVIAGYREHNELEKHGWTSLLWKAGGGYANLQRKEDSKAKGKENAKKEMLWFSPYCLNEEPSLFGDDNKQEEI